MPDEHAGGGLTGWLWDNRRWVLDRARDLADWFGQARSIPAQLPTDTEVETPKRRGILMISPGGVGKTTFARFISGERDILTLWGQPYNESLGIERFAFADPPIEIVVPPGQSHRRDTTWPQIEGELAAGAYRGVVLIVSYGHHSLGLTSYKRHRLYKGEFAQFLEDYTADRRKDEQAVLDRLSPLLRACLEPVWLLTVVTKQDLWCDEQEPVERHYRGGRFAAEIDRIRQKLGSRNFRSELVFCSLTISNFVTGERELLRENTAGYDSRRQIQSVHQLIETLDALRTWEGAGT